MLRLHRFRAEEKRRQVADIDGMIADFMRKLDSSPYFDSVDLVETAQSELDGVQLKHFVVNARLSYSGKALGSAPRNLKFPEPSKQNGPKRRTPAQRKGNRQISVKMVSDSYPPSVSSYHF